MTSDANLKMFDDWISLKMLSRSEYGEVSSEGCVFHDQRIWVSVVDVSLRVLEERLITKTHSIESPASRQDS
jgi:hypothetical protein